MRITDTHVAIFMAAFDNGPPGYEASVYAGLTAVAEVFAEPPPLRDYRKDLWVAAYLAGDEFVADTALVDFDKRFPS